MIPKKFSGKTCATQKQHARHRFAMSCALTFSEAEEIRRMQSFKPNVGRLARNRHLQNPRERSVVWRKKAGIASLFAMLAVFSPHPAGAQVSDGTSAMSSECADSIR